MKTIQIIHTWNDGGLTMNDTIQTIGILTSGGDAPGMNAAIRAVVRTALEEFVSEESDVVTTDYYRKRSSI